MNKFIHRTQPQDASLNTWKVQAKASKNEIPSRVDTTQVNDGNCRVQTQTGKGTNMEYLSVLHSKEGCAVCSDVDPMNPAAAYIMIPGASTMLISSSYTAPCREPGYNVYFPQRIVDGKNCVLNRQYFQS